MSLNCQAGQMAWIKNCPPRPKVIGHAVKVLSYVGPQAVTVDGIQMRDVWLVEYQGQLVRGDGCRNCMPDAWLTPWTAPGDDEVDEMVKRLGAPEGVAA